MALYEPVPNRRLIAGQAIYFACWALVTAFGAYLRPDPSGHGTHTQLGLPPCPSVWVLGRPCPGCGLTTSWTAFIHGHWAESLHAHPFGPLLYLMFTVSAFYSLRGFWTAHRFNVDTPRFNWSLGIFAAFFFGFGIWRALTVTDYRQITDMAAAGRTVSAGLR